MVLRIQRTWRISYIWRNIDANICNTEDSAASYIWDNIYAKSTSHVTQKWVQINLEPLPYLELQH